MHGFRTLFFALVAATSLAAASLDDAAGLAQREEAAFQGHRQARGRTVRSVVLDHGKRLKMKRQTQNQQEEAARNQAWADNFAKQNESWQKAANADLARGETPQEFDEYVKSHGGESSDSSAPAAAASKGSAGLPASVGASKQNVNLAKSNAKQCGTKKQSSGSASSSSSAASQTASSSGSKDSGKASSSSSSASSSSTSSSSSSSSGGLSGVLNLVSNGKATYYNTGLGACGWTNKDSDYIVALPVGVWNKLGGTKSNGNIVCGKKIKVSNGNGKTIEVEVTDQCPSCDDSHLDLSPSAFSALGDQSQGVIKISWGWVGQVPGQ
ncbi:unnamed protein product [Parajaminaea phylloscopi]